MKLIKSPFLGILHYLNYLKTVVALEIRSIIIFKRLTADAFFQPPNKKYVRRSFFPVCPKKFHKTTWKEEMLPTAASPR